MEIGGGLNFERKQFLKTWSMRLWQEKLPQWLAGLPGSPGSLWIQVARTLMPNTSMQAGVTNTETLSPEQELVQDLITITHCFSSRLYGLRNYRKALQLNIKDDQSAQDTTASNV